MKILNTARCLALTVGFLALVGCTTTQERLDGLATSTTKLTTVIQAKVRYADPNNPIPENQLLATAIKNKPAMQRTFRRYPILIRHDMTNVVVLVCTPDGKHALIEDASWTLWVDRKWYLSKPLPPAEFTMDPANKTTIEQGAK